MGFRQVRVKGSHHFLYSPERDVLVSVPVHRGRTLAPGTLRAILRAAGIDVQELIKHL